MTESTANRLHIKSLSDLGAVADQLTFGGPPECRTRQLCLVGLESTYGLKFRQVITLDAGGPLTRQALKEGLVDVALMFTTDPAIETQGLVELDDDRGLQPAESITPLVRKEIVDRWGPGVVDVIDSVSARLTTSAVRDLNGASAPAGTNVAAVVSAFLAEGPTMTTDAESAPVTDTTVALARQRPACSAERAPHETAPPTVRGPAAAAAPHRSVGSRLDRRPDRARRVDDRDRRVAAGPAGHRPGRRGDPADDGAIAHGVAARRWPMPLTALRRDGRCSSSPSR